MEILPRLLVAFFAFCFIYNINCEDEKFEPPPGTTAMKFTVPQMDDEESHSNFLPTKNVAIKCDACKVITFKLHEGFEKTNKKFTKLKYNIPESEILEIFEKVCVVDTFNNYGIKEINKVKRLSGPGTDAADSPGVMQGGGKWPGRIAEMCNRFVDEMGEVEIYKIWKKDPKSLKKLQKEMCYGSGIRGHCKQGKDEL
ncbi:DgyrCDS12687 [Dimorphilus gyrociliatus]|uniref:DgyrCDS12687 n=1 Tax=Dimorphilus gyrociliatus TaxID=2664684 RepID=A0A7I8W7W0_9ANNE|nr:DgyrCDS12687 [Dimorphilus gyrociliatus]